MKKLFHRLINRETMLYLLFGVLTTVINYLVFWVVVRAFGEDSALWANAAAFVAAVTFAYLTNKLFVFESKSWEKSVIGRELSSFLGARVLSFAFEELGLLACVNWLKVGRWQLFGLSGVMIAKIVLSFLVVVINYVLSKFFIFKPAEKEQPPEGQTPGGQAPNEPAPPAPEGKP